MNVDGSHWTAPIITAKKIDTETIMILINFFLGGGGGYNSNRQAMARHLEYVAPLDADDQDPLKHKEGNNCFFLTNELYEEV